jgi:hypothetical protein
MKTSEQIDQISKAMSIAQGEMKPASKSTVNPFFKSTYSTISQIMEVIRDPMAKNHLCIFQDVISTDNNLSIYTRICHASGQWLEFGPLVITLLKKDAQSIGSACSYGKRYALTAAIGVVSEEEDDDGEKSMVGYEREKQKNKPKEPTKIEVNKTNVAETPSSLGSIDKVMWDELKQLIESCDSDFQTNLWVYLNSIKVFDYVDLDEKLYKKTKNSCLNHLKSKNEP